MVYNGLQWVYNGFTSQERTNPIQQLKASTERANHSPTEQEMANPGGG
jgi:hypothetical protein